VLAFGGLLLRIVNDLRMNREDIIEKVALWSGIAAALSLIVAGVLRFVCPELAKAVGYPVVAAWVLLPPVWFFFEWVVLCRDLKNKAERDRIKHLHELARNIWLGLVVVLALTFGIDWKP
jgi:cytochrome b561